MKNILPQSPILLLCAGTITRNCSDISNAIALDLTLMLISFSLIGLAFYRLFKGLNPAPAFADMVCATIGILITRAAVAHTTGIEGADYAITSVVQIFLIAMGFYQWHRSKASD